MSEPSPADWIRPLLGRADDMRAEVWLRCTPGTLADARGGAPVVASGTLVGPECSTAATIPTTVAATPAAAANRPNATARFIGTRRRAGGARRGVLFGRVVTPVSAVCPRS